MERSDVPRVDAHNVRDAAGEDVAEQPESGSEHSARRELPCDRGSRLQNRDRRGIEQFREMRLDDRVQRLIHVMRNRIEGAGEPRDFVMRTQRIRVERVANADRPRQRWLELPRILRVQIEIQEVERLVRGKRERLRCRRRDAVDELRQRRVRDGRNATLAEIVVIQAKYSGVRSKPDFVRAVAPGQIVVDEQA